MAYSTMNGPPSAALPVYLRYSSTILVDLAIWAALNAPVSFQQIIAIWQVLICWNRSSDKFNCEKVGICWVHEFQAFKTV